MQAEFVIVGAGSAGCAMAYRLSQAGSTVIVIEFGGSDLGPLIQMPAALSYPMSMNRYNWGYWSEPEPYLGGRKLACPRGKVIGGSSSINGMVYVRGHARDFDTWAEMGAKGWSYADVLPYYKRMENWHNAGHGGDSDWRGSNGPLHVTRGKRLNPLVRAFVDAGREAGYQTTDDYNGYKQEGFGPMDQTIFRGQRWSAAKAYLRPALASKNCSLIKAFARKVMITDNRATGVEIERNGKIEIITATREVILAASSINSPKLLMHSGIGPAKHLKEVGVEIVKDLPGVGQNLQDHLEVYFQMSSSKPVSLYRYWSLFGKAWVGLQWLTSKSGPGASNQFESAGFIRSQAGVDYPDIQYHFLPIAVNYDGTLGVKGHGFQAHVGPMRSNSRGMVTLRSKNPKINPKIQFNYMSTDKDWLDFRKAVRLTRELFDQKAFKPFSNGEIKPGNNVNTDEQIDNFIREYAESAYHPCGTCRMGSKYNPDSVVDEETRVIGIDCLRVADSSIFPQIPNGNLNAPSIMVGEKASDFILGIEPLPKANMTPWTHPDWERQQR
jgi:choline dehydrogenase